MIEIFSRHYKRIIFAVLLIISFLLMTLDVQVDEDTTFLEKMIFELYYPFQQGVTWFIRSTIGMMNHYILLVDLTKENEMLHKEVQTLKKKLKLLEESSKENYRLRSMLGFSFATSMELISAEVLCRDSTSHFNSMFINKGSKDGIEYNMPVITDVGVVGKVVRVAPHVSQVQLLIDKMSCISAICKRTGDEGIVQGTGEDLLVMKSVAGESPIRIGDILYSSGYGSVYPRDLEIGTVVKIRREFQRMTKILYIQPAVNFVETLRVFVIKDENFRKVREILKAMER